MRPPCAALYTAGTPQVFTFEDNGDDGSSFRNRTESTGGEACGAEIAAVRRDDARREARGARARAFARCYDWSIVGPRLAEMYAQVAGRALPDAGSEVRICA